MKKRIAYRQPAADWTEDELLGHGYNEPATQEAVKKYKEFVVYNTKTNKYFLEDENGWVTEEYETIELLLTEELTGINYSYFTII